MGRAQAGVLGKLAPICLALPDTKLTMTWGKPHFRVGDKIFAGCDDGLEDWHVGFKLPMARAAKLVATDARFSRAAYVGHKGWVNFDTADVDDWDEVRELVTTSYRLIAPKRSLAKLDGQTPNMLAAKQTLAKKTAAKRKAAR
jgi:predicted DNA-binding protein (MmcQ/YjbR family)